MIGKGFNEGHFKWGITPAWIGSLAPIRIALFMLLSPKSTIFEVMAFCCGIGKNVLKHQPAAVCYKHSSGFGAEDTAFWCCENITWFIWTQVRIASLPAGSLEWSGKWVKNWSESWQPKSQKFELTAGRRYYLEALHHGKAPSDGMRVGVQIHNTWLNPQVVNNYYIERHEIRAHALCLPDIQVSAVYLAPAGQGLWIR